MKQSDFDAIESAFTATRNLGTDKCVAAVRELDLSETAFAVLELADKRAFRRNVSFLRRCWISSDFAAMRMAQLKEGQFSFWVYRSSDCSRHSELDGLILTSDHAFWVHHAPPNSADCSCYIVGASSQTGAIRLGGCVTKQPPETLPLDDLSDTGYHGVPPFSFEVFFDHLVAFKHSHEN